MKYAPVLSVRQPWATMLVLGLKPVENRTWPTKVRGTVYIHSGMTWDQEGWNWLRNEGPIDVQILDELRENGQFKQGGIIGWIEIKDCVDKMEDPWFFGPFGFVVGSFGACDLVRCNGALKFFEVEV